MAFTENQRTAFTRTPAWTEVNKPVSPWRLCAMSLAAIPLAMAALPIYVNVPAFYAQVIGLNLGAIGALLLLARIFDAVQDPLLGYWSDRTRDRRFGPLVTGRFIWLIIGAPLLAVAMLGLFAPPALSTAAMSWWLVAMLLLVYTAFSMVQISYQAYGAEVSSDPIERTRITAFREGFGLLGVFVAAALPQVLADASGPREGYAQFAMLFAPLALVLVGITIAIAPRPQRRVQTIQRAPLVNILMPLKNAHFRKLLRVFLLNGIAASIPATLVLFFIQDVIAAPKHAALFLIAYFAAGVAGMPVWVTLSARIGKGRAWLIGMLLSITAFVWAFSLGAGDIRAFAAICVLSGLGLGADLALPPSILADVIDEDEKRDLGRNEGAYFGAWNLVTKLNLALAAGVTLPLLGWIGYTPGAINSAISLTWLAAIYALLPCLLKTFAIVALIRSPFLSPPPRSSP